MTRIQLRHDTATNWTTANPTLAEGEAGVETDTNKFKIGDGVTAWNSLDYQGSNVDLSNYYTKTQTDNLLEDKADDFVVANPITLEAPVTSSLSFYTYDKGSVNYNYKTGEYYYGFASDRTLFQIVIDIPEDINIDVYSDYWKIGDSSLSFSRTQPNSTANNAIFEIYADNGTENVTVSRLWYGSSHYRAGNGTGTISNPFKDGIAKHTANNTSVYSGGGNGNLAAGYSSNIVSGNRLSRIVLYCMCQCTGSWGTDFSSASWGNYWSDSTGAKLKSLKLYTSASDTEGVELIRYAIAKPALTLNIDNTLVVQNNLLGVNTNEYYNQTQTNTMLDNKVDLNFDNMNPSQTAKDTIIGWGMPDYSAGIDISTFTSSSNQYTVPCDGIVYADYYTGNNGGIYVNNVRITGGNAVNNTSISGTVIVSKSSTVYVSYPELRYAGCHFFPLKGAN